MLELYEHNERAYKAARYVLEQSGKAAILHPTGTGKSFIGFKLSAEHPEARILWLTPSDYIVRTQLQNVQASSGWQPKNVQFITYSKLMLLESDELALLCPDYVVLDEFHRCGAECWGGGVQRLLALYPSAQILGLSATNIRYLDNQRDMADELFDGNIASEITLGEAIARDILPAPTYITTVYAYQQEIERYQKRVSAIREKSLREKSQKHLDALRRALEQADGLDEVFAKHLHNKAAKLIVFCADYTHLQEMREKAGEWFAKVDPQAHIYTAYSDDPTTSEAFAAFKADSSEHLKLLFCIDMLNEGVHVPGIDGVIMLRPTVSPIIYKQQLGRALSAGDKKTPLIFDIVNNFENLYSIGTVQEEALSAMGYLYGAEEARAIMSERFHLYHEVRDCRQLFEALQASLCAGWEQYYHAAAQYFEENGHLQPPKSYKTKDGMALGSWLTTQRRVRAGQVPGSLDRQRIAKLDAIGMVWENRLDLAWERGFAAAVEYYAKNGNLNVTAQYTTADGYKLGMWIVNQRQTKANNKSCTLTPERIRRLDEIGMVWDVVSWQWEKNYAAAAEYYAKKGDLNVPIKYVSPDGVGLGKWMRYLRMARAGVNKGATPTQEQIMRLDAIGMRWQDAYEMEWRQKYASAREYCKKNGNSNVPACYKTSDGIALGKWLYNQRQLRAEGKLSAEREQLLTQLGMAWAVVDGWEKRFQQVVEYYKQHGNVNIPAKHKTEDGIWLGTWLYHQRRAKAGVEKEKPLTPEQRRKLEQLGL